MRAQCCLPLKLFRCMSVVLQALSVGREWQLLEPQLLTTKGYKLLHCCHMAMELLQNILALQHTSISSSSSKRCTATLLSSSDSSIRDGKQGDSTDGAPAAAVASRGLEAAARQYVASMCNGRLVPTTWLNEVSHMNWAAAAHLQYSTQQQYRNSCCMQSTYACSAESLAPSSVEPGICMKMLSVCVSRCGCAGHQ